MTLMLVQEVTDTLPMRAGFNYDGLVNSPIFGVYNLNELMYGNVEIRHCPSRSAFKFFLRVRPHYFGIRSSQHEFCINYFVTSLVLW